ncbi:28789_t:CDS:2, partial [Racocetra persica]
KLIQDMEDGTSFIHKHPRNVEKSLPNSLIRKQIVKLANMNINHFDIFSFLAIDERDNELVAEAKSLPGQRIVRVPNIAYAPTSAIYDSASRSATYYSPPPPPAANFYSDAPPAEQSPSAANYNPILANFFSSLLPRKASS